MREGRKKHADWAWSLFWQADNLRACAPVYPVSGGSSLDEAWRGFFGQLPADAAVLDIGTGNGALALLAREALGSFAEVHGVDVAEIDPTTFVSSEEGLQSITFHPGVAMEQLPFGDDCFDAVVGQYALEYSDMRRSVAEVLRALKVDGRFRFLVHASGGTLEARNVLQQRQAQTLLESPLFQDLRRLLPAMMHAQTLEATGSAAADAALQLARTEIDRFSDTLTRLEEHFANEKDTDLVTRLFLAVRQIPAGRLKYSLSDLLKQASDLEARLEAQALRLQAMVDAALDDARLSQLQRDLLDRGATHLEIGEATSASRGLLGYWISGQR
ncbi:class I SAM-dependent methyltransferase [Chromatocurvus halotolerans]|uniref:Methyltransferase family protein n=1 Tax=Chromatocurvus halotolerans TaxID=1132028 RepID=A0A4R2LF57_9GAMM|nr:methyltransferase domain-containing protein [Chromatocurvus halotolerans]TCO77895.1 methyltransferase family protein [Chromatocurvus halotolerans]